MKRAVGYVRVSTEEQAKEGTSLESQKDKIEKYCDLQEWELINIYCDAGISGGSLNRPQLNKLRKDAVDGKFDIIVFSKLDRLGRNSRDIHNLFYEMKEESNVDIICTNDPSLNTNGPMGSFMVSILAAISELEKTTIWERMSDGIKRKWHSGKQVVGDLPYGYRRGNSPNRVIEIDEMAADIYKKIVDSYLIKRMSVRSIADMLNKEGIMTPSAEKAKKANEKRRMEKKSQKESLGSARWDHTSILKLLKNPAYKGEAVLNKKKRIWENGGKNGRYCCAVPEDKTRDEWITVKFPPLISSEKWDQIQKRRDNQKIMPKRVYKEYEDHFILDGMVYCGICGTKMKKRIKKEKNGKVRLYYVCYYRGCGKRELARKGREICELRAADAEAVDNEIFARITDVLSNPSMYLDAWLKDVNAEEIEKKIGHLVSREKELDRQLATGFEYIRTIINPDSRKLYMLEQEKTEKMRDDIHRELINAQQNLELISGKTRRFTDLSDMMQNRISTKISLKDFLYGLSFQDRKAVVEAMISPENGGRCKISYAIATDFLTDEEMQGMTLEERVQPLKDRNLVVEANFNIDPDKIEAIITGLDRDDILGIPSAWHSPGPHRYN